MKTMREEAQITTAHSQRYLGQLCKHFAHKTATEMSDNVGHIEFPFGICDLAASEDRLQMQIEATDHDALNKLRHVMTAHLERFAFREAPNIEWAAKA